MYTLDLKNLVKTLEKEEMETDPKFPFLTKEDREAGDFPLFYRIMEAKTPEEIQDISLDQIMNLLHKVPHYGSYLTKKLSPLSQAVPKLMSAESHLPKRRVL